MTGSQKKSFMQNSLVLMLSLLFVKISGLLFKLPIVSLIGKTGYGYFSSAYSIYLPIYILALSGFPAAVSRFVAAEYSLGNFRNVKRIQKVALVFFTVIGAAGTAVLALGSDFLSSLVKNPNAAPALLVLAPTVLFCCIMSVYRGYYNGLSNLTPSAVSQSIEALGKLVIGVGSSYLLVRYAMVQFEETGSVFGTALDSKEAVAEFISPYAAAAAILGVSVGSIIACAYILLRHKIAGDGITKEQLDNSNQSVLSSKTVFKRIVRTGIPISLGAAVMQLCSLIDNFTIINILDSIMGSNEALIRDMYGYGAEISAESIPNILWGCFGIALIFYNLVPLTVQSFSQSAIPDITDAYVQRNKERLESKIIVTMRMSLLFALPAGIGIISVAKPLISIFDGDSVVETVPILQILCVAAIFSALCQPVTSILQSIGRYDTPVKVMVIAAVVKLVFNILLIHVPTLNVLGAAVSSGISYCLLFALEFILLKKHSGARLRFFKLFLPPLISALLCGGTAFGLIVLLEDLLGTVISLVISVVSAVVVYFISAVLTGALTKNEIYLLPKGKKIAKVLEMMRILR